MIKSATGHSPEMLLEIIRVQTEIAKVGLDLGAVMALVAERVQRLTGANGAMVEIVEGNEMVYRAASGMAENLLGMRLRRIGSLSGLCVETGEILRCDDSESDARVDREACRKVGLRSMVVTPLKHGDKSVGVLKIASSAVGAFTDADAQVVELMSELIGAAMFHAVHYETSELYHRATHDPLTGLPNRALFFDRLHQNLAQVRRSGERMGILNLDMDGLKLINDRYGHRAGDAAITEMAARMREVSRQSDTVARLGGDEFGVIMSRVSDRAGIEKYISRIAARIGQPFFFEQHDLSFDASAGLAIYPDDAQEMDSLIEKADQSMYAAKRGHKATREASL